MLKPITLCILSLFLSIRFADAMDCKSAKTEQEKAICSDHDLMRLDQTLNESYESKKAEAKNDNQGKKFMKDQIHWLTQIRRPCGTDLNCMTSAYQNRIREIEGTDFDLVGTEKNQHPSSTMKSLEWNRRIRLLIREGLFQLISPIPYFKGTIKSSQPKLTNGSIRYGTKMWAVDYLIQIKARDTIVEILRS